MQKKINGTTPIEISLEGSSSPPTGRKLHLEQERCAGRRGGVGGGGAATELGASATARILPSGSNQMASELIVSALFTIASNWK